MMSCSGHLENTGSTSSAEFSGCEHIYYTILRKLPIFIPFNVDSIRSVLEVVKLMGLDTCLPKF